MFNNRNRKPFSRMYLELTTNNHNRGFSTEISKGRGFPLPRSNE